MLISNSKCRISYQDYNWFYKNPITNSNTKLAGEVLISNCNDRILIVTASIKILLQKSNCNDRIMIPYMNASTNIKLL